MNRRYFFMAAAPIAAVALAQTKVTDDAIHDKVMMKLAADPVVKGGALSIEVKGGVVTVKGTLPTEKAKLKAQKVIHAVKGVTGVKNEIEVRPSGLRP
jgi:hyperosmotically inducible periplasmic protein